MVLDSARNHDDLVVDLTNAELTKEVLEGSQEKIDFSFVHVVLSRTQEAALSWKYRHQRYARLYQAIDNEDLGEIAMCCKQGLSVNWYNEGGRTPFMKACIEGRTAAVGFMLKHCKPLINLKSKSPNEDAGQWTALEAVLMIDDYSMAELLLKNGAEFSFIAAVVMNKVSEYEGDKSVHVINTPCLGGKLPLFVAIRRKFPDLVLWFLNNGANISFSEGQKTALKEAVLSGNLEIVSLIHKRGGVITPELIRLACDKEFVEIAHYLYANVEQPNKIDLYSACFLKKIPQNEIDALIQGDCKTAQPDGMLPLATACLAGNVETARVFLRRGADLYMPSKRRTFPGGAELPLFYAVSRRRTEVVRYLVDEEGVSPTCIIQGSTPPFIEAVRNNSSEIMEIMLRKNNINLNAQDSEGKTALLVAVHNGATGVVKLLLERGVSPYIADNTGNLPLHYAYSEGYLEIVALLQEAMLHPKNKTGKTPKEIAKKIPEPKKSTFVLVMDSEEPHIQENITQCKGYICHEVLGDGECGYRAFGIERDKAYDLMMDVEQFDERVFYLLQPGIIEALRTEAFYEYLLVNNNKITTEGITFQQIVDSIEDYAGDADIILSYIDYDVRDGLIDSGWAHPSTLQALAHIQGIELHIWRLDAEEKLIPHEYAEYIPEDVVNPQRTDLLFVNGNHFNRIELTQRAEVRPASPREHFGSQQAFLAPPSPSQQSNVREKGEEEARVAQLDK
jgi:ankyrin repeat protein